MRPLLPSSSNFLFPSCQLTVNLYPLLQEIQLGGGKRIRTDDPLLAKQVL
jgi:hypothetical protein